MIRWARGGAAAVCLLWLSCAATPDPPRPPDPPQAAPPAACDVCEGGTGACGCGPPPPRAARRCSDGTEEQVDVACVASGGTCRWRVTSSGCPEPCAPEACGPSEALEEWCPDHVTLKQRPVCLRAVDGQCRWELERHSCTRVCDVDQPCPSDHFCSTAVGDCDGPGVCVLKPATCVRARTVCGCFGNEYAGACAAAKADEPVEYDGRCQTVVDVPPTRWPLCRDESQCGPPPPTAPPQRCPDGQESVSALRCERRDGGCFWGADEPTCPPPLARTKSTASTKTKTKTQTQTTTP